MLGVYEQGTHGRPPLAETRPNAAERSDASGRVLGGRYRLIRRIGSGGMATVYLAEHLQLHKRVAVKVLDPALRRRKPALGGRFLREARAAARLRDPHIVDITDYGESEDGLVFFAMEYLVGEELGDMLQRKRRLRWPRAVAIVIQILGALRAAHRRGIVHRDIKPENCIRVRRGTNIDFIKVLDFGIAKVMEHASQAGADGLKTTAAGTILGTAAYISPEQAQGHAVDHRADLYSVGAMLFELVTGRIPFTGATDMSILAKHVKRPAPSMRKVAPGLDIPPELDKLVLALMAKDPNDRPADADEVIEALRAIGERPRAGLGTYALIGGTALAAVIGWANLHAQAQQSQVPPVRSPTTAAPTHGADPCAEPCRCAASCRSVGVTCTQSCGADADCGARCEDRRDACLAGCRAAQCTCG